MGLGVRNTRHKWKVEAGGNQERRPRSEPVAWGLGRVNSGASDGGGRGDWGGWRGPQDLLRVGFGSGDPGGAELCVRNGNRLRPER